MNSKLEALIAAARREQQAQQQQESAEEEQRRQQQDRIAVNTLKTHMRALLPDLETELMYQMATYHGVRCAGAYLMANDHGFVFFHMANNIEFRVIGRLDEPAPEAIEEHAEQSWYAGEVDLQNRVLLWLGDMLDALGE
jgi:hypothetical protein